MDVDLDYKIKVLSRDLEMICEECKKCDNYKENSCDKILKFPFDLQKMQSVSPLCSSRCQFVYHYFSMLYMLLVENLPNDLTDLQLEVPCLR